MTTPDISPSDPARDFLRHSLATLAYRAAKPLRGAPDSFASFRPASDARSAGQILAHMGDLFDWALSIAQGQQRWQDSPPLPWPGEVDRFFAALSAFDAYIASGAPLHATPERLFQGPVADALTHTGQLSLMRRLAGSPVRGENYFAASVTPGHTGPSQPAPRREFD